MTPQDTSYWQKRKEKDEHRDWRYDTNNWITDYEESTLHPHRRNTLAILRGLRFDSLIEIGCSVGPNLKLISEEFPEVDLYGIDPNPDSVKRAKLFTTAQVELGDARELWGEWDVILADASLMYVTPEEITEVMDRIAFSAKKAVLIIERCCESKTGEICGGVWGRDYATLLKERGFKIETLKMTPEDWPESPNWQKFGYYILGTK